MTGEYFATTGLNDQTRIGSFHFPSCTHGRQRDALGHGHRRHEPDLRARPSRSAAGRRRRTRAASTRSPSRPGTYPTETADQGRASTRRSAATLVVPERRHAHEELHAERRGARAAASRTTRRAPFQRGVPTNCDLTRARATSQLASAGQHGHAEHDGRPEQRLRRSRNTSLGRPDVHADRHRTAQPRSTSSSSARAARRHSPNITLSIRATTGATPVPTGADLATATIAGFNDGGAGGSADVHASPARSR